MGQLAHPALSGSAYLLSGLGGLCDLLPLSISLEALDLKPYLLQSSLSLWAWVAFSLTCEQTWPTDLQLKVEFIFHWVGHLCVQESGQTQSIPGVRGLGAKTVWVFSRKVCGGGGRWRGEGDKEGEEEEGEEEKEKEEEEQEEGEEEGAQTEANQHKKTESQIAQPPPILDLYHLIQPGSREGLDTERRYNYCWGIPGMGQDPGKGSQCLSPHHSHHRPRRRTSVPNAFHMRI